MAWMRTGGLRVCVVVALAVAACGGQRAPRWGSGDFDDPPGGVPVDIALSSSDRDKLGALTAELAPLATLTSQQLMARHPLRFTSELGYDPRTASGLSTIQASGLALSDAALTKLTTQGFVIDPKQAFASMGYGYQSIYAHDLPVYVSLDSILNTVHLSYDAILEAVEAQALTTDLATMLRVMRERLPALAATDATVAVDLDVYTAVALGLLTGHDQAPVVGAEASTIDSFVARSMSAEGFQEVTLFGLPRTVDFSQMKPRGHYAGNDTLERYFRAMMWLGRTDFRLIETLTGGERVVNTRQLASVIALNRLVVGEGRAAYDRIDAAVSTFVGRHDYMHLAQIDALMEDLDLDDLSELYSVEPAVIAQAIIDGGYGTQAIASRVMLGHGSAHEALPLDRSFALLGQRYVVDSHVFSNVVWDRVPPANDGERTMPDPLDAAYAALGNPAALPLLRADLDRHQYAPYLEQTRVAVDALDDSFWDENLYNRWLTALRVLAPTVEPDAGLPSVARSEAWSRRILNTQLGSWAQLRHDTILYAKQSYGTGIECEFPDAYVDPYPESFAALVRYALHGERMIAALSDSMPENLATRVRHYFQELASVATTLQGMAEHERAGTPFDEAQLAFINDLVRIAGQPCGSPPHFTGWYGRLLFNNDPGKMDPTIADVHTFSGGDAAPQVLHVATGLPRLMVVTVNTCTGPRAYAGLAFAYHEVITGLDRLTDQTWAPMAPTAPDVPWMQSILPSRTR